MTSEHLSKRLAKVADYVPQGARLADIGSDHAYLASYLVAAGRVEAAVCGEVAEGPYQSSLATVQARGLADCIQVRLADGLAAIQASDRISCIVIAGMGGSLIVDILAAGQAQGKLDQGPRLVLQPNVGEAELRRWLETNHYQITTEYIIEENQKIYEIIVADYSESVPSLSEEALVFGPFTKASNPEVFHKKLYRRLKHAKGINQSLRQSTNQEKQASFKHYQELIEEQIRIMEEEIKDD